MAGTTGNIQFIVTANPGDTKSAKQRRKIHSHAARAAHARNRRLRTIEYQASKRIPRLQVPEELGGGDIAVSSDSLSATKSDETCHLVLSSPLSLLSADRRDPFASFAREFEPVEHFLLDHYIQAVIPYMNINCNKLRKPSQYLNLMTKEWVRLTLANTGSLNGTFLSSCRHLWLECQKQTFAPLAIQYKLSCVQTLRETIYEETPSVISDSTIAIGVFLAYDEVQLRDYSTLKTHLNGLIRMVEHNGGPQTMGANGFLERLVSKFTGLAEQACRFKLEPW